MSADLKLSTRQLLAIFETLRCGELVEVPAASAWGAGERLGGLFRRGGHRLLSSPDWFFTLTV
jgi:hypothetical protein